MNRISKSARIGDGVSIGDFTVVHGNVVIEAGTRIGPHCEVGVPCGSEGPLVIGPGCVVRSHSVLYEGSRLGGGTATGHHVLVREGCEAGRGVVLGSYADIEGRCRIGDFTRLHSDVHVAAGTELGRFVFVHPRVQFTNDPFPPSDLIRGARIGDMAVLCTSTVLLPGVRVGLGSFVAACSVVRQDVPDACCAAGDPARPVCPLDKFFVPGHGMYHPWIRRFGDHYPAECEPVIREILASIRAALEPRETPPETPQGDAR